jgi:proline iminopeptidase
MHIKVNGTRLWFDVEGAALAVDGEGLRERPSLLLVHGGPGGFDHSYFKPEFAVMTSHAQVVYLDLRGHGRSDWGDATSWSMEACADDIRAFCDAVGIARPIVLGHSLGGPIVLLYGARHPGHAAGLVIQSGFARWDHDRLVGAFHRFAGPEVAELASRSFAGDEVSDDEWDRVYRAFGHRLPDAQRQALVHDNADLNHHGMDLVRRTDLLDQLGRIDVPTLVSVGSLDPVTPVEAAEEIVAALPAGHGLIDVIQGAGHFTWLDEPDSYWPALVAFVARVSRQA